MNLERPPMRRGAPPATPPDPDAHFVSDEPYDAEADLLALDRSDLDAPTFEKLIVLPECMALTEAHVTNWLFDHEMPLDHADIGNIARKATTDSAGKPDGTPNLVYQRLRDLLPNWAELAAGGDE